MNISQYQDKGFVGNITHYKMYQHFERRFYVILLFINNSFILLTHIITEITAMPCLGLCTVCLVQKRLTTVQGQVQAPYTWQMDMTNCCMLPSMNTISGTITVLFLSISTKLQEVIPSGQRAMSSCSFRHPWLGSSQQVVLY